MPSVPKISNAEWRVMKVLWSKSPLTAGRVYEALEKDSQWKPKTVKTLIDRLVQKGALRFEKRGRNHHYSPAVDEEACLEAESTSFLERFFGGSLNPMLVNLVERGKLKPEDIHEMKRILAKGEIHHDES
jgi:BlaI family transcriptional regulator, penicillinase repressor